MPPGDGDNNSTTDPPENEQRRRTPPPVSRTPPPRTSSGDRGAVEHRSPTQGKRRGSTFGRMLGRQGLNDALEERLNPYEYESTKPLLRWLILGLFVFALASAAAAFTDSEFRSQVEEWKSEGLTLTPLAPDDVAQASLVANIEFQSSEDLLCNEDELASGSVVAHGCRSIDRVIEYAASERLDCTSLEALASAVDTTRTPAPGCERVAELSTRFDDLNNRGNIINIVLVLILIVVAFPFSSLVHRSSRNLRTLKSEGQKHSPDGTIFRFFIPIVNVYKPLFMIIELFKASDPSVPDGDGKAWKKKGSFSPIAVLWAVAWGSVVIFNPVTVSRIFFNDPEGLADLTTVTTGLIVADILLVVLSLLAMPMAITLSRRQEARAAKYGTVTVTPTQPRDSLERALDEDAQRRGGSTSRGDERNSKRRQK